MPRRNSFLALALSKVGKAPIQEMKLASTRLVNECKQARAPLNCRRHVYVKMNEMTWILYLHGSAPETNFVCRSLRLLLFTYH